MIAVAYQVYCIIKDDLPDSSDDEDETENLRGRLEFIPEGASEELVVSPVVVFHGRGFAKV